MVPAPASWNWGPAITRSLLVTMPLSMLKVAPTWVNCVLSFDGCQPSSVFTDSDCSIFGMSTPRMAPFWTSMLPFPESERVRADVLLPDACRSNAKLPLPSMRLKPMASLRKARASTPARRKLAPTAGVFEAPSTAIAPVPEPE